MRMNFVKMNGAGNDFVMLDNRDGTKKLSASQIARLCDRHRGVGADGVLLVEPPPVDKPGVDFTMRYFNSDGGEAEMCGNGARCFAKFASLVAGPFHHVAFQTRAGVIAADLHEDGDVTLAMSEPHGLRLGTHLDVGGEALVVHFVNTGVPHAVVEVGDVAPVDVAELGKALRHHPHFAPAGTNVNFFQQLGPSELRLRTYERGVEAETLACGTGVVAAAIVFRELHGGQGPVSVTVQGGDTLQVHFTKSANGRIHDVTLRGPADICFEGVWEA